MKVLMCYHSAEYGGVEKQIEDIIAGLSDEFEFIVACPNGPLVKDYIKAGAVKHIELKPKFELDLSYSYKIAKIIKSEGIDIVHSHELRTGVLATLGAWVAGARKRIYHVHTPFVEWKYSPLKRLYAIPFNTIANFKAGNMFATDVLALTESIKRTRIQKEFIIPSKIKIIPNAIDIQRYKFSETGRNQIRQKYGISESEILIGNISRFSSEKGHSILINAFASFIKDANQPNVKLILAGGGALLQDSKFLAKELGVENQIIFTGHFEEVDKTSILSALDLFVFPTLAEGFGIVLIEAMAMGLPCLVSNLPVLEDVAGDSVLFFQKADADDLSKKLLELTDNKQLKLRLSEKATEKAQEYTMERFWGLYRNLYNS